MNADDLPSRIEPDDRDKPPRDDDRVRRPEHSGSVASNGLASVISNSWTYSCEYFAASCSDTQLPSSLVSSVDSRLAIDVAQGVTMTILIMAGYMGKKAQ